MYVHRAARAEILAAARRHLGPRRVPTWLGYAAGFFTLRALVGAACRLDDLLWPQIARQRIERPVFLFANARSGTTLLHRLMSLDERRFASVKLHHSVFRAVCIRRAIERLARLDRRLPGRPLQRLVDGINAVFFRGWEGIHEMGIDQVEEDEALFALALQTPSIVLLLPYLDELPASLWFDSLPRSERDAFLDDYEDALRRHLYASGGDRVFLNKSALLAPRLRSIFERFPDARFVYLVRHPYEALPSFLSMFHDKWATHSPEIRMDSPEARALAGLAIDYLRYALDCRKLVPAEQLVVVRYDDLVADPRATVLRLYDWLGLPVGGEFRARLDEATGAQRRFASAHRYSLEQFGLSEDYVYENLRDVFEEFGFARTSSSSSASSEAPCDAGAACRP